MGRISKKEVRKANFFFCYFLVPSCLNKEPILGVPSNNPIINKVWKKPPVNVISLINLLNTVASVASTLRLSMSGDRRYYPVVSKYSTPLNRVSPFGKDNVSRGESGDKLMNLK